MSYIDEHQYVDHHWHWKFFIVIDLFLIFNLALNYGTQRRVDNEVCRYVDGYPLIGGFF